MSPPSWKLSDAIAFETLRRGLRYNASELSQVLDMPKDYISRFLEHGRQGPKESLDRFTFNPEIVSHEANGRPKKTFSKIMSFKRVRHLVGKFLDGEGAINRLRELTHTTNPKHQICRVVYLECELNMRPFSASPEPADRSRRNPLFDSLGRTIRGRGTPETSAVATIAQPTTFIKSESPAPVSLAERIDAPLSAPRPTVQSKVTSPAKPVVERYVPAVPGTSVPNWICKPCTRSNYPEDTFCENCDAPRAMTTSHVSALSRKRVRSPDLHYTPPASSNAVQIPEKPSPRPAKVAKVQTEKRKTKKVPAKETEPSSDLVEVRSDTTQKGSDASVQTDDMGAPATIIHEEPKETVTESEINVPADILEPEPSLTAEQWQVIHKILELTKSSDKQKSRTTLMNCLSAFLKCPQSNDTVLQLFFTHVSHLPPEDLAKGLTLLRGYLRLQGQEIEEDHDIIDYLMTQQTRPHAWEQFMSFIITAHAQ